MAKLAIIATIKTVSGKRDEYLMHLKAHCPATRRSVRSTRAVALW